MEKVDNRIENGLNNKGYPLRKIIEKEDDLHILECGHRLRPVSNSSVRSRRCPECVGKKLDTPELVKNFAGKILENKKITSLETGEINLERELPNGGNVKFSILNIQISYEETNS